jgi:hypothetical protein
MSQANLYICKRSEFVFEDYVLPDSTFAYWSVKF